MGELLTLSSEELRELTGSPQRALQVAWLRQNRWRHEVDRFGRPRVARAYFERRMVGVESTAQGETEPNWAAI